MSGRCARIRDRASLVLSLFFRQTPRFTGRISRLSEKEANSMPVIFFLIDAFSRMLKLSRTGRFI